MGRWSRALAHAFINWMDCAPRLDWLEIGCGTGALTTAICARANPASVVACDPSPAFIDYAKTQLPDPRVTFVVASADDFPIRTQGYGAVTSLLALNFFPSPASALARMTTATQDRCVIAACVWDYAGDMQFLRYFWDAAAKIAAPARDADEGVRFSICRPDALRGLFADAGLQDVVCEPLEIATPFPTFADYWQPFLGGTGPAPSFVAALDVAEREALQAELQAVLPVDATGAINLRARAWAVRGTTPPRGS